MTRNIETSTSIENVEQARYDAWLSRFTPETSHRLDAITIPADLPVTDVPEGLYDTNSDERTTIFATILSGHVSDDKTIVVQDNENGFTEDDPVVLKAIRDDAYLHLAARLGDSLADMGSVLENGAVSSKTVEVSLRRHELRYPAAAVAPAILEPKVEQHRFVPRLLKRRHRFDSTILRLSDLAKDTDDLK